jgi:NAD(P)-dependent dehydrogenase (short-subunit alcohol dehydrogenase family)
MGRASALVFAREGALVVGCDLSVGAVQAIVELVRGAGGEMVSKQLRHLTESADCQALVDLAPSSSAGSTRCSTSPDGVPQPARGHRRRGVGSRPRDEVDVFRRHEGVVTCGR